MLNDLSRHIISWRPPKEQALRSASLAFYSLDPIPCASRNALLSLLHPLLWLVGLIRYGFTAPREAYPLWPFAVDNAPDILSESVLSQHSTLLSTYKVSGPSTASRNHPRLCTAFHFRITMSMPTQLAPARFNFNHHSGHVVLPLWRLLAEVSHFCVENLLWVHTGDRIGLISRLRCSPSRSAQDAFLYVRCFTPTALTSNITWLWHYCFMVTTWLEGFYDNNVGSTKSAKTAGFANLASLISLDSSMSQCLAYNIPLSCTVLLVEQTGWSIQHYTSDTGCLISFGLVV